MSNPELEWAEAHYRAVLAAYARIHTLYKTAAKAHRDAYMYYAEQCRKQSQSNTSTTKIEVPQKEAPPASNRGLTKDQLRWS